MADTNQNRPAVMDELTETQLQELEFQFDESDREQFDQIASNYGWSTDTRESVWNWFASGERASGSRDNASA